MPSGVVGGIPSDGDDNQSVPALHVVDLILHGIKRGLFRSQRDAESGVDDLNGCFRGAVGACRQWEKEDGEDA
jgi:hypothetical protein